ncbi:MAG: glycosyl hydrolase [Actinobacteria bacterium HGW-Actinobacteria-4]|nr:MAG: glycosyl hydrolase [Actinobacteria bacterium HGW-Actinobacteria-4]
MSPLPEAAEAEIARRLATLSLQEKVQLLTGASTWATHAIAHIGLRPVVFADGPAGVQGPDPASSSTSLPAPTALAATWDVEMAAQAGSVFASEARRKRVDVVLAPVLNLQRTPVGGRHFENFSEDPLLTSSIGAAMISAIQAEGIGACAKHFVANDSETERTTYVARVDTPTLRQAYLVPFERAVRSAGAWTVMAAYNRVDHGTGASPMTEHPSLLTDILKDEWGFDGVVVSDWEATSSTADSANGGLDLVMPGPGGPWDKALESAVRAGAVSMEVIDDKVRRLLRLAARVGKLDGVTLEGISVTSTRGTSTPDAAAFSRLLSASAMVVVRHGEEAPLPFWDSTGEAPRSVAVLGANAAEPYVQGGGSAHVNAPYEVSPLEGLHAEFLGSATEVHFARGGRTLMRAPLLATDATYDGVGARGVRIEILDAHGHCISARTDATTDFRWVRDLPDNAATVRLTTHVELAAPGDHVLDVGSIGRHQVWIDGDMVTDVTEDRGVDAILDSSVNAPPGQPKTIAVDSAGSTVQIVAELQVSDAGGYGRLVSATIRHRLPERGADAEIAQAVELAARCDAAVVVVGTNIEVESEGWDRKDLRLPGDQDRLVVAVLEANPRTIVVVNGGAPLELPWLDSAPTVLWAWLPGQEFGNALADVLSGRVEPAGRLPWTLPARYDDVPVPHAIPQAGVIDYSERALVGYRGWPVDGPAPAAPFGHGLGWSSWEYLNASVAIRDDQLSVQVRVSNIGARTSSEVVQVYVEGPATDGLRLAGFAVARSVPARGIVTVAIDVDPMVFEVWDEGDLQLRRVEGTYEVLIGRSAADIRLRRKRRMRALAMRRQGGSSAEIAVGPQDSGWSVAE